MVLRCRELAGFLEEALPHLPARSDSPFLHGQLDDVLRRLQLALRPLGVEERTPTEKSPSFLSRLAGKKQPPKGPSAPRYDMEGNAWTIPATEVVGFLSHSCKTGLLWVLAPSETFVLEFARGNLVHATSNAPPAAFRLGEILLREKLLEPTELAQLIDLAKAADDLLGSYLMRSGRLQHSELQRVLTLQVQQLFHRLMDAQDALFRFQEGGQLLRSQGLEVNITHLLLESAHQKDEERQAREGTRRGVADLFDAMAADSSEPDAALPRSEGEAQAAEPVSPSSSSS
ncbi:MAG: DUF4388 domain-containing protein [Planctomycetes bacterium]|nr:DUF4388 domain-containing protein [Planctomycetota bacterium]